jgi:hypothetical protein
MSQNASKEAKIILAIDSIEKGVFKSVRAAGEALKAHHSTISRRMAGKPSREASNANREKLSKTEQEAIIKQALDMDARGFSLKLTDVAVMANLLIEQDPDTRRDPVGKTWAKKFVSKTSRLKVKMSRPYDYERAKCEDPRTLKEWFRVLECTVKDLGIQDLDIWNFDETGFAMGQIQGQMVVTASEKRQTPKKIQSGNREWVTVIQAIGAKGAIIPPYIIFPGKVKQLSWFYNRDLPSDWQLDTTENGWTNNEKGLEWLKHFEEHSRDQMVGAWRLLILDGHESHCSVEFENFCEENMIKCFYLPPHSSHITQPLDVGCFGPLKWWYGDVLSKRMRWGTVHIDKTEFLSAFLEAFPKAFTTTNIEGGFRHSGLVPFNPEYVISQLDVHLRTPTPPTIEPTTWQSQTPQNAVEFRCQTELIKTRITRHQDSSPTPILEALASLEKGIQIEVHTKVLISAEATHLRQTNQELSGRKKRKNAYLKETGPISVAEGQEIIDSGEVYAQLQRETKENAPITVGVTKKRRRCGKCGTEGHNSRTCQIQSPETQERTGTQIIQID